MPDYPHHDNVVIKAMLNHLVERGIAINGLTLAQAVARYRLDVPEDNAIPAGGRSRSDRVLPTDLDALVIAVPSEQDTTAP